MYKGNMKRKLIAITVFLAILGSVAQASQLFNSDEILDLTLEYNVKKFKKDRGEKRVYHPAVLSYTDAEGKKISVNVQIKARGKLRRLFLKCSVPVYKVKFNQKETPNTLFDSQKSLKVVTHCKNKPKRFENYYIQEYLIYRVFNIISDLSFKVRMANFTYIDSTGEGKPITRTAFFIESYKGMAKRLNAKTTKVPGIKLAQSDLATATMVSVFQYMIGNTDWSIRSGHNIKWIVMPGKSKYFPIPFDFDLAGIIDASYARPDERFPIRSVRERFYRGHTKSMPQFQKAFVIFKKHKDEIIKLYQDFPLLSKGDKKQTTKYIRGFYKIIDNEKLVKRYFINNYRGRPRPKR